MLLKIKKIPIGGGGCPSGEQVSNGGFESGEFSPWEFLGSDWGSEVQSDEKHSGNYAALLKVTVTLGQDLAIPIPVSCIESFKLWYKKQTNATGSVKVTYTDETDSDFISFTVNDTWTEVDILPSLDSEKTVKTIWIVKGYTQVGNNDLWLDDVSLIC